MKANILDRYLIVIYTVVYGLLVFLVYFKLGSSSQIVTFSGNASSIVQPLVQCTSVPTIPLEKYWIQSCKKGGAGAGEEEDEGSRDEG